MTPRSFLYKRHGGFLNEFLQRRHIGAGDQLFLRGAGGIIFAVAPDQVQVGEAHASAASRAATTERIVFEKAQTLHQLTE